MELQVNYLNQILIFIIFASSLNLLMGYTGQVSVAAAAFGALGGYGLAYLWLHHHTPLLLDLLVALVVAAAVGVLVGIPALRLSTEWLILLTLAVQTIILGLLATSSSFGGAYGLQDITGLSLFGTKLISPTSMLPLFLVLTAITLAILYRLGESPYGRVLRAIREDEIATRALGKNVFAYKLTVFGLTSGIAGVAGALLVIQGTVASPATFSFDQSTALIAMVIFGGMGNLFGTVVGATVITLTTPFFQDVIKLSPEYSSLWRLVAYGLLLTVVMRLRPQGVIPEEFSFRALLRHRAPLPAGLSSAGVPPPADEVVLDPGAIDGGTVDGGAFALAPPVAAVVGQTATGDGHFEGGDPPAPQLHGVRPPEPEELVAERARHKGELVLQVSNLSKRFGGIQATDGLAMELHKGTITALVGPNGAGKTTVFNLLTGAIRPDTGKILLNGRDVFGLSPDRVANLGMVRSFQDVRIFPRLTCLQNVMLAVQDQPGEHAALLFVRPRAVAGAERRVRESAMRWLDFVGLSSVAGVACGALAFGQQKLVALARVLATEAEVLLLDEPASGIDHQWVEVMLELIEQLRPQGRTVCIVEHNLNVVGRLADHIYFMELGRVTAEGSYESLTSDTRLAEAYFGTA